MVYFSFVDPWGYEDSLNYFTKCEKKASTDIYFHRELLGYSKENRFVELITISGHEGRQDTREETINAKGLFPNLEPGSKESKIFSRNRAHKFDKDVVFLSARVHPGEVQSSHVLNGILQFLYSRTPQSKAILTKYCFKIIPLINPDGVARGYYRLDTHNHNLNRFYLNPCPEN